MTSQRAKWQGLQKGVPIWGQQFNTCAYAEQACVWILYMFMCQCHRESSRVTHSWQAAPADRRMGPEGHQERDAPLVRGHSQPDQPRFMVQKRSTCCLASCKWCRHMVAVLGLLGTGFLAASWLVASRYDCLTVSPFLSLGAGTCISAAGAAATGCANGTFSRPCNSGPCEPTAWLVGAWGVCSKTCADKKGAGTQTRTVNCYRYPQSNASVLVSRTVLATLPAMALLCSALCAGQALGRQAHLYWRLLPLPSCQSFTDPVRQLEPAGQLCASASRSVRQRVRKPCRPAHHDLLPHPST